METCMSLLYCQREPETLPLGYPSRNVLLPLWRLEVPGEDTEGLQCLLRALEGSGGRDEHGSLGISLKWNLHELITPKGLFSPPNPFET